MRQPFILLVLAALAPATAGAAVLSQAFEFTVAEVSSGVPPETIAVGDMLAATFAFDTEASEPLLGGFRTGSLTVEGFGTSSFGYTVFSDGLGTDFGCCYDRVRFSGDNPATLSTVGLILIDSDGTVLSGPGVPGAFDFSLIDSATLNVGLFEGEASFSAVFRRPKTPGGDPAMPSVPLPASLPLLGAGIAVLSAFRRSAV